jgi:hypothetical protein
MILSICSPVFKHAQTPWLKPPPTLTKTEDKKGVWVRERARVYVCSLTCMLGHVFACHGRWAQNAVFLIFPSPHFLSLTYTYFFSKEAQAISMFSMPMCWGRIGPSSIFSLSPRRSLALLINVRTPLVKFGSSSLQGKMLYQTHNHKNK